MTEVRCECGRLLRSVPELVDVHSVGLKLCGSCPSCGRQVVANKLWKVTEVRHQVVHQEVSGGSDVINKTVNRKVVNYEKSGSGSETAFLQ